MSVVQIGFDELNNHGDLMKPAGSLSDSNSQAGSSSNSEQMANTLRVLLQYQSSPNFGTSHLPFVPTRSMLLAHGVTPPDEQTQEKIASLTHAAQDAATSLFCGSIVAGHTGESDEYADVGLWLGEGSGGRGYGKGQEIEVLRALGLEIAADKIATVQLNPSWNLPASVNVSASTPAVEALTIALTSLEGLHCFFATVGHRSGVVVACFLLGKSPHGWCGLVGMGDSSDE
ncbi:hypothetical protein BV22DRAFT_549142 [Leucogyrophana mollusca]|uniref:Uncharacterized protein n=1 Tax=Leucogyrophana mollusca TaxID=85980 RepID=A0ACB8BFH7_9AGAM|nr:hypothetical protein BV22DRAFT_549142 [Leucogyrophana mollusca]